MAKRRGNHRRNRSFYVLVKNSIGKIGTLNIVLICVFGYMIYINWKMINVFLTFGSAPETAWCALIAALLGECGICGWIKTSKEKHKNRSRDEPERDADIEIQEIPIDGIMNYEEYNGNSEG